MADRYWVGPGIKADGFDNRDATSSTAALSNATTADNAAYRMTGDMELIVKAQSPDWTPATIGVLALSGNNSSANTLNWQLFINTSGIPSFRRGIASGDRLFSASVATGFTDGTTPYWIKVEYKQNNGGVSEVKFYTSTDGSIFTQLGSTQTNADTSAGISNTTGLFVGNGNSTHFSFNGIISRVTVKNSVGGTTVYDADFEAATIGAASFTESSSNGFTVTMNGNAEWNATAGTKWATTSGGTGGAAVPTAADDVYFDTYKSNTTISAAGVCRSLNCTGYTGTMTHNASTALTIGDATAGAGNIALKFVAGMTYTIAHFTGSILFISTSATQQTIDFAGKTSGSVTFNPSSNGSWQYLGAHTAGAASTVEIARGSVDFNGQTCSFGNFGSSGSSTRSITLGAATFSVAGVLTFNPATNLTFSGASSTITMTGASSTFTSTGTTTFGTVNFTGSGAPTITGGTLTFGTLTRTGTAVKTDTFVLASSITVSGTFTVNGNSAINRVLVQSNTVGTVRTITAATVSAANVDFRDITGAGAGSWNLASITGNSGDCGGNTNITFTSPTTQTATGTSSFTWSTHGWTSRVPLPQDTAVVSNAFSASQTVTMDMPRYGSVSFAGSTGNVAVTLSVASEIYGNFTLRASMGTISQNNTMNFIGASAQTVTMAGNNLAGIGFNLFISRSKLTLQDAFSSNGPIITSGSGYLDTNNKNMTVQLCNFSNASNVNLLGTSVISVTVTSSIHFSALSGNISAASAEVVIVNASASTRNIFIQVNTLGTLTYTVPGSTGKLAFDFYTPTTINTLNFSDASNARTVEFTSGGTYNITNFNVNGTPGKLMSVQATTPGSAFTLSKSSGVAYADYISLKDSTTTGGAGFVARASTNVSGNSGWAFPVTAVPAGGNWSSTSTWDSGVVPTAATDVALIGGSGQVTIDVNAVCRSLDCTGYTNTLTHASGQAVAIGDSTAGAANVALKLSSGMTYTVQNYTSCRFDFNSTSATVQAIDTVSKSLPTTRFMQAGTWQLTSALVCVKNITLTFGTLNTNGQTVTTDGFTSSNSNTRALTLGSSAITIGGTSGTYWDIANSTGLTLSAASSTITLTNAATFYHGTTAGAAGTYGTVIFNGPSGMGIGGAATLTMTNLTINSTAVKTDTMSLVSNVTVTGTLTIAGNSLTNRILVSSNTIGTTRTITAANVALSNADFMDITGAGVAAPFTGTSLGNALGNSGITFTTPVTRYAVTAGNWSSTAMWSTSSGGGTGASVPLCHDTVIMDGSSGAGTYVADMPRMGADITCTGFTRTLSLSSTPHIQYGSLTLGSGMTLAHTQSHSFNGRSSHTITGAGKSFGAIVFVRAPGGTYTLQDAFTITPGTSQLQVDNGTFTANNFDVTIPVFAATLASTINMGTGTWNITFNASTGFPWQMSASVTLNPSTSTIVFPTASTAARTFTGGGKTYYNLTYNATNSPGPLIITGANTFNNLNISPGRILTLTSATTTTVTNFNATGSSNGFLYISGGSGNYASTPDSPALSMTGDIDIRCKVALDNWASASAQTLVAKFVYGTPNCSYYFGMDTSGRFQVATSPDGATGTVINSLSSVVTGFTAGSVHWCRATIQPNDGAGHNVVKFYTSNDGSNWTQFGSTVTNSGATLIYDSTAPLEIGADNIGGNAFATGKFYNAQVRNNILDNGTGIVFDADFTAKPVAANTFTESSSNATTVTVNGVQAQAGDGRVYLNSSTGASAATLSKASGLVSCNYMSIKDSTATGGAQWYAGAQSNNVSGNTGWIFSTARDGSFLDFF